VFTEAYELFGHTKLGRKWIESDAGHNRHSVVCYAQFSNAPENLRQCVESRGGKLTLLKYPDSILTRAIKLRTLAYAEADLVVLHVHPNDVVSSVAFGVPGGPPVIYVNHADHEFWVGGSISDLVLDIRESGQAWTRRHRGVARTTILPIPLEEDLRLQSGGDSLSSLRGNTRSELGVSPEELLVLTIGSARKYWPMPGLSFLEAADAILGQCPDVRIVAVGPKQVAEWQEVSKKHSGRLQAIGNQSDLGKYHAAADLYLEGMPAGSLTALLEVCLAGLACVRAPVQVRPPHASDGSAFAGVAQPEHLAAYIAEAVALINNPVLRRERAEILQRQVRALHCGSAWSDRLAEILRTKPNRHEIHALADFAPIEHVDLDYRLRYAYQTVSKAFGSMVEVYLRQLIRASAAARRTAEKVLPELCTGHDQADGMELLKAILPELSRLPNEMPATAKVKATSLAMELMRLAADDGRKFAAWRLGLKVGRQCAGIWRNQQFHRALAKSLPGVNELAKMRKGRRQ